MEQTDLMRKYPPSYVAKRLGEILPNNLHEYLSIRKDAAGKPAKLRETDVLVTVYFLIIARTAAEKRADHWVPISIGDLMNRTKPSEGPSGEDPFAEVLAANPIVFVGLSIIFSTQLIPGGYFEAVPRTVRYLPTDRFFEYMIGKYEIEPIA